MRAKEKWIWLPQHPYEKEQHTIYSGVQYNGEQDYVVAEFKKTYCFPHEVVRAQLRFSGDTAFQLFCNDAIVATGPACVGGDFLGNDTVRENYYAFETTMEPRTNELRFFARVKMLPVQQCEYSKGHGGFMLSGMLTFADGTTASIGTDESWSVRKNGAYAKNCFYDGTIVPDDYTNAVCTDNIWNTVTAPIPVRTEQNIVPENHRIALCAGEEKSIVLTLDKIWGGFVAVNAETKGEVSVNIRFRELEETNGSEENMIFCRDTAYRGFYLHSAGNMAVTLKNKGDTDACIDISFIATHYPITKEAETVTSDSALNLVLNTCKHTLKICRQTHHLDSPRHCEPLACTGDYAIESLMTPFSFGDMRLAEFDLIRTAISLERENGRMFHTTYSMIWVRMLYDTYMATGNLSLLRQCERALRLLLKRTETYFGENGLIENPPDYLFIDWIYIDGISLHHPPKALGQTCMNLFFFDALHHAEKIFRALARHTDADMCAKKRAHLQKAVNELLFDRERGIYFEGLNTPTDLRAVSEWLPENVKKRYYLKHANILAAYTGICDDKCAKQLIEKVMTDEIIGDCQPYFMHYLLEAVYRLGLREKYTLEIISRWKKPVQDCAKGLVEGFVKPEPTYWFDHSHAWGGTPLYSLPKALLGLEITEPGMKALKLSPSRLGLSYAKTELLTPYGKVICEMREGQPPCITAPREIRITT